MTIKRLKKGYVMLLTTIIFMMVSVVIILGLSTPIIKQIFASRDVWSAKQSYYLSEAGVEDVLFRLKDSTYTQYVGSTESISLNGYSATTTFSGSLSGIDGLTVSTLSNQNGYDKKIETKVKKGDGVSFIYGLQVGQGGFTMTGSSGIIGNVFSSGDIIGCSSCYITGSAILSNGSMVLNQKNDTPTSSPNSINFGDTSATRDFAQSFQISTSSPLTQISFYIKKIGSPSSVPIKIVKNSGSSPSSNSGDVIASATLDSSLVTNNYDWVDVSLSPNPNLVVGNTYWVVFDAPIGSASNKYVIGANLDTNYSLGTSKLGVLGDTLNNTGYDSYFKIYLGDFFSQIKGDGQYNQLNVGTTASDITWAHNVSYVESSGPIRCQNELYNNKSCDQTYQDPPPSSYPVSNGNITAWETEATAGGIISGGYSKTDSSSVSFGPKKITGDLHIGGSVTLSISGTLYVTGNLIIDGSGIVKLGPSYGTNSGIIVVDGRVVIGGSAKANGTGQSGSYLMIVSNSTCPTGSCSGEPAIDMSGSGGAVILNAQKGTINFEGSAGANEATANMITMSGSTKVTYQSGIANTNFSSGPSGSFNISSWKELDN